MAKDNLAPNIDDRLAIYSIGHSNHPIDRFLFLLKQHDIEVLADVRSAPYSRYVSHFNRPELEDIVERHKIGYRYMGDTLGGRPDGDQFYDIDGHVLYGRLAEADFFKNGLERLVDEAATSRVAIMCSEENPTNCHRRLLLARVLTGQGIEVCHIRGTGLMQSDQALDGQKKEEQLGLWGTEDPSTGEELDEWKSIRPVLRRRVQESSLGLSNTME